MITWHSNISTNRLRFNCLFVNVNEMAKAYEDFIIAEKFGESAKPCATELFLIIAECLFVLR